MKRIFISMTGIITCMNLMAQTPVSFYPQENTQDTNIDTHLVIVFDKTVKTGSKGIITVTDKTTRKVIDRIDMSIPAGPIEGQPKNPNAVYTPVPYIYKVENVTNRKTRPGTSSGAAKEDKCKYQRTIIGGFSDPFHFYPVICHGNKATIYLHNNMLEYGHEYEIKISKGTIEGWNGKKSWTFRTKKKAPSADLRHIVVAADGSGDFSTLQGAMDWIPDSLPSEGFGPIDESASTANLLEFNSHDKEGKTIDISKRNKHVRQLDAIKDAETIGKYSNVSWFLNW